MNSTEEVANTGVNRRHESHQNLPTTHAHGRQKLANGLVGDAQLLQVVEIAQKKDKVAKEEAEEEEKARKLEKKRVEAEKALKEKKRQKDGSSSTKNKDS